MLSKKSTLTTECDEEIVFLLLSSLACLYQVNVFLCTYCTLRISEIVHFHVVKSADETYINPVALCRIKVRSVDVFLTL